MTGIEYSTTDHTREAWLQEAVTILRPRFVEIGMPLPEQIHISVGFGYGAKRESAIILGQCWARRASADEVNHIFISPQASDPAAMLATLVHELIHAADDCEHGHRGPFAEAATRLGLEGPMLATTASIELAAELISLANELGDFPHGELRPVVERVPVPVPGGPRPAPIHSGPGKQGTRMVALVAAQCCGYRVRTTQKWIDEGMPSCPHGSPMRRA